MFDFLESFLDGLSTKGASKATLRNYRSELTEFLEFSDGRADNGRIATYTAWLWKRGLAVSSIARRLYELRSFFRFLQREGLADVNPDRIEVPKTPKRLPRFLTHEQVSRLLTGPRDAREGAILEILYGTGMRLSELVGLDLDDFSPSRRTLKVRGKGDKERHVVLGIPALEALQDYIAYQRRPHDGKPALFLCKNGTRISKQAVGRIVRRCGERGGLGKNITPHLLRHTFATHMLNGGANLRVLQELLGHADLRTTQIYAHVTIQGLRNVYSNSHPLAQGQG